MAINAYLTATPPMTPTGQSTTLEGIVPVPQIEILEYSHNVEMTLVENTASNVSRKAGRVKHDPFTIKKNVDVTTPLFHMHCSAGTVFPAMAVRVFQADGLAAPTPALPVEFLTIIMVNVIINSVALTGSGEEMPSEEIKLNYTGITWTYNLQTNLPGTGAMGQSLGSWNLQTNSVIVPAPVGLTLPPPSAAG